MRDTPPPLRFLVLALGGWVCARAVVHLPSWWVEEVSAAPAAIRPAPSFAAAPAPRPPALPEPDRPSFPPPLANRFAQPPAEGVQTYVAASPLLLVMSAPAPVPAGISPPTAATQPAQRLVPSFSQVMPIALPAPGGTSRWSASAWLFVRRDGASQVAPGGTLGGSQAGARLTYRLNADLTRPLSLSTRVYAPLDQAPAAEAAVGLDWKPMSGIPVHILAERRQALGDGGRSAFSITLYGGVSDRRLPAGLRLDAYAQAGVVGLQSRDLFADGSVQIGVPLGALRAGVGAWGGAQPGVARLDVGPQLSLPLRIGDSNLRVSADWRFRIAGEARPSSGPAFTIGASF